MENFYEIVRWDGVIGCGSEPKPMLYFQPDCDLLEYIKRNNWRIRIIIQGSGCYYDNRIIWGTVNKALSSGGCRPNFYVCTGLYTITLDTLWSGYGDDGGVFSIVGGCFNVMD